MYSRKLLKAMCCGNFYRLQAVEVLLHCKPMAANSHVNHQLLQKWCYFGTVHAAFQQKHKIPVVEGGPQKELESGELLSEDQRMYEDMIKGDGHFNNVDSNILGRYIEKAEDDLQFIEDDIDYADITDPNKRLFYKMVDIWITEAGATRRGHREFIQASLNSMKKFNVHADISAYLKLLECFPDGKHTGIKRSHWFKAAYQDKHADHALGIQIFRAVSSSGAVPNGELFNKATDLFGRFSPAAWNARQLLFWYPRLVSFCKHPVSASEVQSMSAVEIAFYGLRQMIPGIDAEYKYFAIDKSKVKEILDSDKIDYIMSVQTPDQKALLAQHDSNQPIYVEGPHVVFYKNKTVRYFVLRSDPREAMPEVNSNANILTSKEWWSQFYQTEWTSGKKILQGNRKLYPNEQYLPSLSLEKGLEETSDRIQEVCDVDKDTNNREGPVYAIACTDYNSPIALQSWVKGLALDCEVLQGCTVVFREEEPFLLNAAKTDPYDEDEYEKYSSFP